MVVVEESHKHIGSEIRAVVTSALQTSAGRMIFAKLENWDKGNGEKKVSNKKNLTTNP
jgi:hypothetical protein